MLSRYQARLTQPALADRLTALKELRSREGYMADMSQEEDGSWLWWESHCPICAAARACRGFCRSELALFRQLLAPAGVEREQYLLDGTGAASIASGRRRPEDAGAQKQQSRRRDACFVAFGEGMISFQPVVSR